ncbi:MAG TPA: biopolymer transporter Tol [Isosphaeraceae bacterium]|nr:biopolymer transporter Tol [Isosphaeraceae bacterium]
MSPAGADEAGGPISRYRIWATRAETAESVLLEDSAGPLTSPGWSPDGSALAFGRLVAEAAGRARFEIVVQDAPRHQRVIQSVAVEAFRAEADAEGLPALSVAWSPDGRYLAVPQLKPNGLAIVRVDNGRVLKAVDGGYMPSWSPDGVKLAFYRDQDPVGVYCLDSSLSAPQKLAEVGRGGQQPPSWTRDSRAVVVVQSKVMRTAAGFSIEQVDLVRLRVDQGRPERLKSLTDDPAGRPKAFRGVTFTFDRDAEELFLSVAYDAQPSCITWVRPRENAVYKVFNPFHVSVPISSVAVSPAGKHLAMRVGPRKTFTPPALCDLETEKLIPLVPDDAARLEWLATIMATARTIMRGQVPGPVIGGGPPAHELAQPAKLEQLTGRKRRIALRHMTDPQVPDRPTALLVPGEMPRQQEAALALRRLGQIGRTVCDRPAEAPPADAEFQTLLDEARLFCDYLQDDYKAALADLEAVDRHTVDPDHRLRLMGLRAQIYLGLGDSERAAGTAAYAQANQAHPMRRLEMTPSGPTLTTEPTNAGRWAEFLVQKAESLRGGGKLWATDDDPNVNTNADAPTPGFGLDPQGIENLVPGGQINGDVFRLGPDIDETIRARMRQLDNGPQAPPPPQPAPQVPGPR